MHLGEKGLVYSPTDLYRFMESSFASFMERLRLEHPDRAVPDEPDETAEILFKKGIEHETALLDRLKQEGRDVCEIPDGAGAERATLAALEAKREVIVQAALSAGGFFGYADFLVRDDDGGYEVWDAKLGRRARPHYIVQLCCYAEMLEEITGLRPKTLRVALGTGETVPFRTDDFFYFYRRLKSAFLEAMDAFDPDSPPFPDPRADHGRWRSHADRILEEADHLCRVANIRASQIRRLVEAGVPTLTALAETDLDHVKGMGDPTLENLVRQARLQVASAGQDRPEYEVIPPDPADPRKGLALLPPASPQDVFFDMEGYPLVEGGLEYLFGATHVEDGEVRFRDFWAHDARSEMAALEGFVDWVTNRRSRDPKMHVYHYAAYEVTALRRLMGKYGTREDEVDDMLRHEVFVDLYRVVRQGVRVGEPSYSIKNVERLYREAREGDVTAAMESVVFYERWLGSGEPEDWRQSPILAAIRDYNRDDCESTHELAAWLRERQAEHGIEWLPRKGGEEQEEEPRPLSEANQERRDLMISLLAEIPETEEARAADPDRWRIQEMLAWLLEFHRREEKPMWWALFDRHEMTTEQLVEDGDCLGGLRPTGAEPTAVKRSLAFEYRFDPNQDTKLEPDDRAIFAHDLGVSVALHEMDAESGRVLLKLGRRTLNSKLEGTMPERLSLIPHDRVSDAGLRDAILAVARAFSETGVVPDAVRSLLLREAPRVEGHGGGALLETGEPVADGAVRIVSGLADSLVCVQGPPGSGKTHTGSEIIARLLDAGSSVGITSNSHRAILNLMRALNARLDGNLECIKAGGPTEDPFFEECPGALRMDNSTAERAFSGGLIGGTAWLFARPGLLGRLDYLFVDEAGQVSVANLVAMSRAARNVVLLGDQMQLGQPIQGSHPGESGKSTLEYLLGDHATIPDDLGIFLPTTWRLHPDLCRLISGAVYQDRLKPEPHTAGRVVRVPDDGGTHVTREAGVVFVSVPHEGNSQSSDEEVERIVEIAGEMVGREVTDAEGRVSGELGIGDILFVAPYNMQVRALRRSLPDRARVASVDKFQGQEAPVVVVSLCASHDEHGPRGLSFLLDRNRLNVAISRARSLAIVVGDPGLTTTRCRTIDDMVRVNLLCRIVDHGS